MNPVTTRLVLTVLYGVVTMYAHADHAGNPLRCGGIYDTSHEWVAVDIDHTDWRCGDLATICAAGVCKTLPVRDSGPLSRYCGEDGDVCRPILVDVPEHVAWFPGLSARAVVVNRSLAEQRLERER